MGVAPTERTASTSFPEACSTDLRMAIPITPHGTAFTLFVDETGWATQGNAIQWLNKQRTGDIVAPVTGGCAPDITPSTH